MSFDFSTMSDEQRAGFPELTVRGKIDRAYDGLAQLPGTEDRKEFEVLCSRIEGIVLDREILEYSQGGHAEDVFHGFLDAVRECGGDKEESLLIHARHVLMSVASVDPEEADRFDWKDAFDHTLQVVCKGGEDHAVRQLPSSMTVAMLEVFAEQMENGRMVLGAEDAAEIAGSVAELPQRWGFRLFSADKGGEVYGRFKDVSGLVDRLTPKAA